MSGAWRSGCVPDRGRSSEDRSHLWRVTTSRSADPVGAPVAQALVDRRPGGLASVTAAATRPGRAGRVRPAGGRVPGRLRCDGEPVGCAGWRTATPTGGRGRGRDQADVRRSRRPAGRGVAPRRCSPRWRSRPASSGMQPDGAGDRRPAAGGDRALRRSGYERIPNYGYYRDDAGLRLVRPRPLTTAAIWQRRRAPRRDALAASPAGQRRSVSRLAERVSRVRRGRPCRP